MKQATTQKQWAFGSLWILINIFCWATYLGFGYLFGGLVWDIYQKLIDNGFWGLLYRFPVLEGLFTSEFVRITISGILAGICWGAIIGAVQQLILKMRFDLKGKDWIIATIIGALLSLAVSTVSPLWLYYIGIFRIISYFAQFLALCAIGFAQLFVLRKYFTKTGWWLAATAIAAVLSIFTTSIVPRDIQGNFVVPFVVRYFGEGFIYGLATLIGLTIIFNKSKTLELKSENPGTEYAQSEGA